MKEGICISMKDADQQRTKIEIPIWVIGDFANMDDMYEEYEIISKEPYHAKIIFDKNKRVEIECSLISPDNLERFYFLIVLTQALDFIKYKKIITSFLKFLRKC